MAQRAETQHFDVVIAGGGLVGASLAVALRGSGLSVAVVEPVAADADAQPSFDERRTALAPTSQRFLASWVCGLRSPSTPRRFNAFTSLTKAMVGLAGSTPTKKAWTHWGMWSPIGYWVMFYGPRWPKPPRCFVPRKLPGPS